MCRKIRLKVKHMDQGTEEGRVFEMLVSFQTQGSSWDEVRTENPVTILSFIGCVIYCEYFSMKLQGSL